MSWFFAHDTYTDFGLCMIFFKVTLDCGGTSSENCTHFDSASPAAGECSILICPCTGDICQAPDENSHCCRTLFLSFFFAASFGLLRFCYYGAPDLICFFYKNNKRRAGCCCSCSWAVLGYTVPYRYFQCYLWRHNTPYNMWDQYRRTQWDQINFVIVDIHNVSCSCSVPGCKSGVQQTCIPAGIWSGHQPAQHCYKIMVYLPASWYGTQLKFKSATFDEQVH